MKKFLAILLAAALLLSLCGVALADYSDLCGGRLIGNWEIYTPNNSLNTELNNLKITPDKFIRNNRECYAFPIDANSCYIIDWYGAGESDPAWHVFTVVLSDDGKQLFMYRPTVDTANIYFKK